MGKKKKCVFTGVFFSCAYASLFFVVQHNEARGYRRTECEGLCQDGDQVGHVPGEVAS